jgi:putative DNA primase/helicase
VSGTLEGDLLCQMTERPLLQLRPLGTSNLVHTANTFTVFANGNNAVVAADMVRRTIQCGLDANMESPETRTFEGDPLGAVKRDRGAYIAAALTIARAYICASRPGRLAPLPSYEAWSDLVRSPLVWLGCDDPAASMAALRQADPVQAERASVFTAWAKALGPGGAYLVAELIERTKEVGADELHAAFMEVARSRSAPVIDPLRLSHWLRKAEDAVAAGLKLTCDRNDKTRPRWTVDWIEGRG